MKTNAQAVPAVPAQSTTAKVTIEHGQAMASSVDVAEYFGKDHYRVLRAIDNLEISNEYRAANYGEGSYTRPITKDQEHRMVLMTKKGFTLLVMGFTGKKAMQFKLAYIEAFEAMEAELSKQAQLTQQPSLPLTCKRFLGSVDSTGLLTMHEIRKDDLVASLKQWPRLLTDAYVVAGIDKEVLLDIGRAATYTALYGPNVSYKLLDGEGGVCGKRTESPVAAISRSTHTESR